MNFYKYTYSLDGQNYCSSDYSSKDEAAKAAVEAIKGCGEKVEEIYVARIFPHVMSDFAPKGPEIFDLCVKNAIKAAGQEKVSLWLKTRPKGDVGELTGLLGMLLDDWARKYECEPGFISMKDVEKISVQDIIVQHIVQEPREVKGSDKS